MKRIIKKFALSSIVIITFVLLFSFIVINVSAVTPGSDQSSSNNNGSQTSVERKLWYRALKDCIGELNGWSNDYWEISCGLNCFHITSKKVRNGEWFRTDWTLDWSTNGGTRTWGGGAYVEAQVGGEYSDGKIICGENDNGLVSKGLAALQVSKLDVSCDYRDDHFSSGVLYADTSKTACADKYNGDDHFSWNTQRLNYFEALITDKTFNNNIPGGSLNSFTPLEEYYAKKMAFEIACANGSPHFGHTMEYNVVAWNPATNKFEQAGYSQKNSGSHKVYWGLGGESTCQELANDLNVGSSVFNAYRDEKLQEAKDGCVSEYNAELDKIKNYRDEYRTIKRAGEMYVYNIKELINGIESGTVSIYLYEDVGHPGNNMALPLVDGYTSYIDSELSNVLANINNAAVYQPNAFNQLAAAAKAVLAHSTITDTGSVTSKADSEDIEQAKEWIRKAEDQVTVVGDNLTALDNFINSHTLGSSNTPWEYETDEQINIICPGKESLSEDWSEFQKDLPGAPDVDGAFQQHEYVDPNDGGSNAGNDPCYSSGIEGMSWILCPTMNNSAKAVDGIDALIDDWLSFGSKWYDSGSEAHTAWGYFRDIANIAIIIVLLIVIVSQVTGYGIDNYGIKKILPRLMTMAVLINISFILCQIAIDISNILGGGLNDMFQTIGRNIYGGVSAGEVAQTIIAAILGAVAATAAGAGTAITIYGLAVGGGGPMLVISIILVVLTALVAVLMFFLMLGARFVIILIFTAIAPLAFACYVLPNTQNLFKKWWNIYKTALIVYPICGGLYGISFIIRGIVFSESDGMQFWMALVAICAPFFPFLLLPGLIKGALAGLGALGGVFNSIGSGLRSSFSKGNSALQNTEAYKSAQEKARRNMAFNRAGLQYDRKTGELKKDAGGNYLEQKHGRFGTFVRGGKTGMARTRAQVESDQKAIARENQLMGEGFGAALAAGAVAQKKAAEAEDVSNWETLIKDQTRDGADEGKLFDLYDEYIESGNVHGARAVARIAGRRKDTAARFLSKFSGTDFVSGDAEQVAKKQGVAQSVAKEIAEGANSKVFLSASPLGFDFASQINSPRDETKDANGNSVRLSNFSYDSWLSADHIKTAMDNYVTDSSELVGVKGSSLNEMIQQMDTEHGGMMDSGTIQRLQTLATETIANRATGPWDSTKAEQLCKMSGGAFEFRDGQIVDMRTNVGTEAGAVVGGESSTELPARRYTETFSAHGANGEEMVFSRDENGQWYDNQGQAIEGDFEQIKQHVLDKRRQDQQTAYEKLWGESGKK